MFGEVFIVIGDCRHSSLRQKPSTSRLLVVLLSHPYINTKTFPFPIFYYIDCNYILLDFFITNMNSQFIMMLSSFSFVLVIYFAGTELLQGLFGKRTNGSKVEVYFLSC